METSKLNLDQYREVQKLGTLSRKERYEKLKEVLEKILEFAMKANGPIIKSIFPKLGKIVESIQLAVLMIQEIIRKFKQEETERYAAMPNLPTRNAELTTTNTSAASNSAAGTTGATATTNTKKDNQRSSGHRRGALPTKQAKGK